MIKLFCAFSDNAERFRGPGR